MTDHDNQMTNQQDKHQRAILPIPDRPYTGLITYDAKDPDTHFPPIEPIRPPEDAPNVLVVLIDDGLQRLQCFRWAVRDAELRAARERRPALQPISHHSPVRAHTGGDAHRPQPPFGRHGWRHGDRNLGSGQSAVAEHEGPAAQTLQLNGYSTSSSVSATRCRSGSQADGPV